MLARLSERLSCTSLWHRGHFTWISPDVGEILSKMRQSHFGQCTAIVVGCIVIPHHPPSLHRPGHKGHSDNLFSASQDVLSGLRAPVWMLQETVPSRRTSHIRWAGKPCSILVYLFPSQTSGAQPIPDQTGEARPKPSSQLAIRSNPQWDIGGPLPIRYDPMMDRLRPWLE